MRPVRAFIAMTLIVSVLCLCSVSSAYAKDLPDVQQKELVMLMATPVEIAPVFILEARIEAPITHGYSPIVSEGSTMAVEVHCNSPGL